MAFALLAIAALVPLALMPGALLFHDVTPKAAILLVGVAIAIILFAVTATRPAGVHNRRLLLVLALQLGWIAVATVFSTDSALSITGTNWRRFGLLTQSALLIYTYLLATAFAGRTAWLFRVNAAAGSLVSLYAILQYFGIDPLLDPSSYHVGEGIWTIVRPPSTLGHANYAAIVSLSGLFSSIASGAGPRPAAASQAARWVAAAICTAAIVLSGSRAALLGLALGLLVLVLVHRMNRRHVLTALGATVLLAAFYVSPPGQQLRARARWFREDPRGGARLLLWKGALAMTAARPVTGWGPETFTAAFAHYQPEELSATYPDFYQESAHNIFFDVLATQGVPGALLLLAVCAIGILASVSVEDRRLRGALLASIVALVTAQQFNAFTIATALCLYTAIAAAVAAASPSLLSQRQPLRALLALPLAAVWICAAIQLARWDHQLAAVDRLLQASKVEDAARAWDTASQIRPFGASADLWYSRRMAMAGQNSPFVLVKSRAFQHALNAGRAATITSEDRQNAWYHLSMIQALSGDSASTESSLRQAIAVAPNWFKPHWTLSRLLLLSRRLEEAEAEGARAVHLSGGKLAEVTATLKEIRAARSSNQK